MSEKIEHLQRAHVLELKLQADTEKDLIYALRQLFIDYRDEGVRDHVMGSPSVGYVAKYTHDPEMTHDRYFELLDQVKVGE